MKGHNDKNPSIDMILETHYDMIIRYIYNQVNNLEDAKDLTQEIFMKVHKNLHKYDPAKASVKTWLFSITNNHIINYYKHTARRRSYYQVYDVAKLRSSEDLLETVIKEEDITYLKSLMCDVLNKKHHTIMNLYFFGDMTKDDIAIIVNLSKKTVTNVIALSINKLKAKLEEKKHGKI